MPISRSRSFGRSPGTEVPSLHRRYPASTVLRASPTPPRPGLSLAGVRLADTRHRLEVSRVASISFCRHAVAITPAGPRRGIGRSPDSPRRRPSPSFAGSAPAFAFSRPARRSLTLRPACSRSRYNDPFHRRLRQVRYLLCRSDCYRLERPVAGWELHPLKNDTFSRRTTGWGGWNGINLIPIPAGEVLCNHSQMQSLVKGPSEVTMVFGWKRMAFTEVRDGRPGARRLAADSERPCRDSRRAANHRRLPRGRLSFSPTPPRPDYHHSTLRGTGSSRQLRRGPTSGL